MTTFWETQMQHQQTKAYYEKLTEIIRDYWHYFWIKKVKFEVLEIGLDVGISAHCFLEFPNIKLTSIDCGDVDAGIREITEFDRDKRWTFHHMTSDIYFAQCKKEFDIIYIDGDHSYMQTKKDLNNAWKFLKSGGLLIGHDFLHKENFTNNNNYGVTKAFTEFITEQNVRATVYPPNPGLITITK